jgi:hypothetical protein
MIRALAAIITLVVALVQFPHSAQGAAPPLISYQGRLTSSAGVPLDTTVALTFRICADSLGSTVLWSETHGAVVVTDGLFQLLLGSDVALGQGAFDGSERWLKIEMRGAPTSTKLVPIVSTPYALRTIMSDTAAYALAAAGSSGDNGWTDNGTTVTLSSVDDSVGIGNSSPKTKLHVGSSATTSQLAQIEGLTIIRTNGTGQPTALRLANLNGSAGSGTSTDFQGLNNAAVLKNAARISGFLSDQTPNLENGALTFYTANRNLVERMRIDHEGNVGIGTASPFCRLDVTGEGHFSDSVSTPLLNLGVPAGLNGSLRLYNSASTFPIAEMMDNSGSGRMFLRNSYGNGALNLYGASNGGGNLLISRSTSGQAGFIVHGNSSGTGDPLVSIIGTNRSVIMDMSVSGDSSVMLPPDAISSHEIKDEAGLAYSRHADSVAISISLTPTILGSRFMSFPATGFALVIATATLHLSHIGSDTIRISVTNQQNASPLGSYDWIVPSSVPDGIFSIPATVQGVMSVDAGYKMFMVQATGSMHLHDRMWADNIMLTVTYFPTWYGAGLAHVKATGGTDFGDDAIEMAIQERVAASEAAIRREFAEKLAKIQAEVKQQMK